MWFKINDQEHINLDMCKSISTWQALGNKFYVRFWMVSGDDHFTDRMSLKKAKNLIKKISDSYGTIEEDT